jgi:hypothetical protein
MSEDPVLDMEAVHEVMLVVEAQVIWASRRHPPMHSPHEGWAVIREELDELWEHVRADTGRSPEARAEAMQIAAMGVRYVLDLCAEPDR